MEYAIDRPQGLFRKATRHFSLAQGRSQRNWLQNRINFDRNLPVGLDDAEISRQADLRSHKGELISFCDLCEICNSFALSVQMSTRKTKEEAVPENYLVAVLQPVQSFARDSYRLVQRCTKPDGKGKSLFQSVFTLIFDFSLLISLICLC